MAVSSAGMVPAEELTSGLDSGYVDALPEDYALTNTGAEEDLSYELSGDILGSGSVSADNGGAAGFLLPVGDELGENTVGETEILGDEIAGPASYGEELYDGQSAALSAGTEELLGDGSVPGETEEGIRYIKGRKLTDEERAAEQEPFKNLPELMKAPEVAESSETGDEELGIAYAALPTAFDAREEGYVTPVKNQNPFNNCWAYSIASLMESSLLLRKKGVYDLSEEQLSYFIYNRENDPLGNTPGDNVLLRSGSYLEGGNMELGAVYLSTWAGMAVDAKYPKYTDWVNPGTAQAYDTDAYMQDAVFSNYSVSRVKQLVYAYKSVGVLIDMNLDHYNEDTAAMGYAGKSAGINHAVTIVGWDNSYSKNNFIAASKITSDGAWIVKNSWGTEKGDQGYFYLSYQDTSISDVVAMTANVDVDYKNNYFYDGAATLTTFNLEPGSSAACIYDAKAGNGLAESLGEISLVTNSDNNKFVIEIYVGLTDETNPTSGTLAFRSTTYTQTFGGVDNVPLGRGIEIAPGTKFSVRLRNAGTEKINFGIEQSYVYTQKGKPWLEAVSACAPNQGFCYHNGSWIDLGVTGIDGKPCCPRIKAHTRTENYAPQISLPVSSATLVSGEVYQLNPNVAPASFGSLGLTWKSSNSSVADVDSSGLVTALNPGTAVVTCYSNKNPGMVVKCSFTVKPAAPAAASAVMTAYNKITISWSQVSGCDGYAVYTVAGDGTKTYLRYVEGAGKLSYTDLEKVSSGKYFSPGTTRRYAVKAYKIVNGSRLFSKTYSPVASVKIVLGKTKTTVRAQNSMVNTLSWNPVSGADGYRIYRRAPGGTWEQLARVTGGNTTAYTDKKITALQKYQYCVRAYRDIPENTYLGPYTVSGTVVASAQAQTTKLSRTENGVRIIWTKQRNADGYRIYRKQGNGSYRLLTEIADPVRSSFVDRSVKSGVKYTYYVTTKVKEFYGAVFSKWTAAAVTY